MPSGSSRLQRLNKIGVCLQRGSHGSHPRRDRLVVSYHRQKRRRSFSPQRLLQQPLMCSATLSRRDVGSGMHLLIVLEETLHGDSTNRALKHDSLLWRPLIRPPAGGLLHLKRLRDVRLPVPLKLQHVRLGAGCSQACWAWVSIVLSNRANGRILLRCRAELW